MHFDVTMVQEYCPELPITGPTILTVPQLTKLELSEIYERASDIHMGKNFSIAKAKTPYREWLKFVNLRLLMAPEGADVLSEGGLAVAYRSWKGERMNWAKIMYSHIRMELGSKGTRHHLFFHCTTYISAFCPSIHQSSEETPDEDERVHTVVKKKKQRKLRFEQGEEEHLSELTAPTLTGQNPEKAPVEEVESATPIVNKGKAVVEETRQKKKKYTLATGGNLNIDSRRGVKPILTLAISKVDAEAAAQRAKLSELSKKELELLLIEKTDLLTQAEETNKGILEAKDEVERCFQKEKNSMEIMRQTAERARELLERERSELRGQLQEAADEIKQLKEKVEEAAEKQQRCEDDEREMNVLQQECQRLTLELEEEKGITVKAHETQIRDQASLKENLEQVKYDAARWKQQYEESEKRAENRRADELLRMKDKYMDELVAAKEQHEDEMTKLRQHHEEELRKLKVFHQEESRSKVSSLTNTPGSSQGSEVAQKNVDLVATNAQLTVQAASDKAIKSRLQQGLWHQDLHSPPPFSLFRAYEIQKNTCRTMMVLTAEEKLTNKEFQRLWTAAGAFTNMQNLLCEMIARQDLQLEDSKQLLVPIGDLGARIFMYYLHLEGQLQKRRQYDHPDAARRIVVVPEMDVKSIITTSEFLNDWKKSLERLVRQTQDEAGFVECMTHVQEREDLAQRGEISMGQYLYTKVRTQYRLKRALEGVRHKIIEVYEFSNMATFSSPPADYQHPIWGSRVLPVTGSLNKQRFLGEYENLFNNLEEEVPFPSWQAIEWLLEDFGLSPQIWQPWDRLYNRISDKWPATIPTAITLSFHQCPLKGPRRYKWAPWSKIDTVPYNWPQIPGRFSSPQECSESYRAFFELHKRHTDPVCFRAAVFCNILSYMCVRFKCVVNVNRYDETRPEFHLWVKLQQLPSRCMRALECMVITQFLHGASSVFALENSNKRQEQLSLWMSFQKSHDTYLYNTDEDVQRNVEQAEIQTILQEYEFKDAYKNKRPRLEGKAPN